MCSVTFRSWTVNWYIKHGDVGVGAQEGEGGDGDSDVESIRGAGGNSLGLLNENALVILCCCSVDQHTRHCPQLKCVGCCNSRISCTDFRKLNKSQCQ